MGVFGNRFFQAGVLAVLVFPSFVPKSWAYPYGPPAGYTGAPKPVGTEPTCQTCHGDGTVNTHAARLVITPPARYCPSTTHSISIQVTNPQSSTNGFEIVAKNSANNISGTLASIDTQTQVSGNYGFHTSLGKSNSSWSMNWTAPAAGTGLITFYGAGHASNGDNQCKNSNGDTGDWLVQSNTPVPENTAPGAPAQNLPSANQVLTVQTVSLQVTEATDADAGDPLTYQFQLCDDNLCGGGGETASPAIVPSSGSATWSPGILADNRQYWWRARASDGCDAFGSYTSIRSFTVNTAADSPAAPALVTPATDQIFTSLTPMVTVNNATDPDPGDTLTYTFEVATDAGFGTVVASATGIAEGSAQTSWQISPALSTLVHYYVRAFATDALGNPGSAGTGSFYIDTKPVASNLSLTPATAATGADLLAGYTFSDVDGNTESGSLIRWYQNGISVPALEGLLTIPNSYTEKGDTWTFTVTPRDGLLDGDTMTSAAVTILNSPPVVSFTGISPAVAFTDSLLTCSATASDADGGLPNVQYAWIRNGSPITGETAAGLNGALFSRGDVLSCEATPDDGEISGSSVASAPLTISNSPPLLGGVLISPADPIDGDDLVAGYGFTDADADAQSLRKIRWYRNGAPVPSLDDVTTVTSADTTQGDSWYFEIRISDGADFSAVATSTTVLVNGLPVASNLAITPVSPDTDADLTITYDYADPEGSAEGATEIRWVQDGLPVPSLDGFTTVPAATTSHGETWWALVRPHDGLSYGLTVSSPAVSIRNLAPAATGAAVTPAAARTNDTLTCNPSGWFDGDGDAEGYQFEWSRNSALIFGATAATLPGSAFLRGDSIVCVAFPYDGFVTGAAVSSPAITILNTAPVAAGLAIAPNPAGPDSDLIASFAYTDADGDAQGGSQIRWYQNSVHVAALDDATTVTSAMTVQGDQWYFEVRPQDGTEFGATVTSSARLINSPPVASNVAIAPALPDTLDDLIVSYAYADTDGNPAAPAEIRWYKGGVLQGAFNDLTTVTAPNTSHGETWIAVLRPYDGLSFGAPVTAAAVTILNSPPVFTTATLPATATEGSAYNLALGVTDADADALTYTVLSGPAGITINSAGVASWTPLLADAGVYTLTVQVSDGAATDVVSGPLSVAFLDQDGDGLPDTWETAHGLNPADGADAAADPDGDGITNLAEWQNNLDPQSGNAPNAPSVNAPADGSRVSDATLALSVNNASDPDGDALVYEFEFFADAALSQRLQHWTNVVSGSTTAVVTVTAATTENSIYYWRARASDPLTAGPWMTAASFRLNRLNEAPAAPILDAPADGSEIAALQPALTVLPATDPDGDGGLTYRYRLCSDPTCLSLLYAAESTAPSMTPPGTLNDNTTYYWSAAISDATLESAPMAIASFRINQANDAPTAPTVIGLMDGSEVTTTTLVVQAHSDDADLDPLTYYVEADTGATFTTTALRGASGSGAGITLATLLDNTHYFLRVRADDGTLTSQWTTLSIFVNTANDAPGTPVLNNPSDNSASPSLRPAFSAYATTDPDGDALQYEFEVFTEAALLNRAAFSDLLPEATNPIVWTPAHDLPARATLYWRARAVDAHGLPGTWSAVSSVRTNGKNDAPAAPIAVSPIRGAEVKAAEAALTISKSTDADGDPLAYRFEIFSDAALLHQTEASADISSGANTITYVPHQDFKQGALYYWRAASFDGAALSSWTPTQVFQIKGAAIDVDSTPDLPAGSGDGDSPIVRKQTVHTAGGCATSGGAPDTALLILLLGLVWRRVREPALRRAPARFTMFSLGMLLSGFLAPHLAFARSAGPPSGHAGDPPLNANCTACHGTSVNAGSNRLQLTVPARYVPGTTYSITIQMLNPQSVRNGFEIIPKALSNAQWTLAGTLVANPNGTNQVDTSGYGKHTAAGNGQSTWTMSWTAPSAGRGTVTFYGAGNAANNNGTNDPGDLITTTAASGTSFTSVENLPPGAPSVNTPADQAIVTAAPLLSVNTSTDGNGDALTYHFELCSTADCATVVQASPSVTPSGGAASWQPTATLTENSAYWWRAWANDGFANGPKMAAVSFQLDAVNEAPLAPTILSPADGTLLNTLLPQITISNASDPDPSDQGALVYDFAIAADAGYTTILTSATSVPQGAGETSWQVTNPSPLSDLATYYLLVTARDLANASASSTASFQIDTSYVPPSAPGNPRPAGVITTRTPTLQADAATSPVNDPLTYSFALDVNSSFNSAALRSQTNLTAPTWTPGLPQLLENQEYFWRVRAYDGRSFGPFASETIFVNSVNDAPGAPLALEPLDGASVNTRSPALHIGAATDPDRDALHYVFEVARDSAFLQIVERSPIITPSDDGSATWQPVFLTNEEHYFWRAHGVDPQDLAGLDSAPFAFSIVNANLPPGQPTIASSAQDASDPVRFSAKVPADPDGDAVFVQYEVYADSKMLVPVTTSTSLAPETVWQPPVVWTRGTYYWRARAADPFAPGAWSNTAKLTLKGPLPFGERPLSSTLRTEIASGCASRSGGDWAWIFLLLPVLMIGRQRGVRPPRSLGLIIFLSLFAACGAETEKTTKIERSTSFREVQAIFNANCIGCHNGAEPVGDLSLTADLQGSQLINAKPKNPVALDRGYRRVTPGEPESSFILYKLTEPSLGEGDRMPYRLPPLSKDDIEVIRRWIADGARTE